MDSAEAAGPKFSSLYAELAAKSSRVAELEARVSALEAENAGLREALAKREATGSTGDEEPISRRFVPGLRGTKHEAAAKLGGGVACDAIELSDDEEGDAGDADSGRTRKRVVAGESGGEADAEAAGGGRGSNGESSAGLEDDDVSVTPRGKKRGAAAAQVVTSDSEDEGGDDGDEDELGSGKDDDGEGGEGLTRSRKRAFRGVCDSDDEDGNEGVAQHQTGSGEDHMLPIYELLKSVPREQGSEDDGELDEAKGHSAPATRRSARLAKNRPKSYGLFHDASDSEDEDGNEGVAAPQTESGDQEEYDMVPIYQLLKRTPKVKASKSGHESDVGKGHSVPATRRSARLVKNQSERQRAACRALDFIEPKDVEGSEDDMEEDDDMNEFINDDSSDNAGDSDEESCDDSDVPSVLNEKSSPGPEVSDGEVDYKDVMACIGRKKKAKEWDYEADMLAAFGEHPELCLKAVCALYRRQTKDEQVEKAALFHNKQGFSHHDAPRGSRIAEFLLNGDKDGPLKKTVSDLDEYDRYAFEFCRKVASHYSKQLFAIYQNKEDPYFHP